MKIIHLTDLHLLPEGQMLKAHCPGEAFGATIQFLNEHHGDADLCMITGDLTHNGDEASYAYLAQLLENLTIPYRLLLGNHDNRANFLKVFPKADIDEYGFLQSVSELGGCVFLCLDTLEDGIHAGSLCPDRLSWLRSQLEKHQGKPAFIFMHHPPLELGIGPIDQFCLMQGGELAGVLSDFAPYVRHINFGHIHQQVRGKWHNIAYASNGGTALSCWQKQETKGTQAPLIEFSIMKIIYFPTNKKHMPLLDIEHQTLNLQMGKASSAA